MASGSVQGEAFRCSLDPGPSVLPHPKLVSLAVPHPGSSVPTCCRPLRLLRVSALAPGSPTKTDPCTQAWAVDSSAHPKATPQATFTPVSPCHHLIPGLCQDPPGAVTNTCGALADGDTVLNAWRCVHLSAGEDTAPRLSNRVQQMARLGFHGVTQSPCSLWSRASPEPQKAAEETRELEKPTARSTQSRRGTPT